MADAKTEGSTKGTLDPKLLEQLVEAERLKLELQDRLEDAREKHYSKTHRKLMKRTEEFLRGSATGMRMKARRDAFIDEYVKDFNGPAAVIRSGGAICTAPKMSSEFLREPYVLKRIGEVIDSMDEAKLTNRQRIMAAFIREANFHGPGASHSARVQALNSLAKILGMEAPTQIENTHAIKGGVMMVPMVGSVTDWEKQAEASQNQLKDEVRK